MVVAIFTDDCAGDGVNGALGVAGGTVGVDFELTGELVLMELVAF